MRFLYFALFSLISLTSFAQDEQQPLDKTLVVGVKETPPFIIKDANGNYTGISVKLWENIANDLNYDYEYKEYDLAGLLSALENNEVDICINPLTVTSQRVEKFDFTQPFFITNLAIAVDKSGQSKWLSFVKNFFSLQFFEAVLLLFIVLLIFGVLAWFFEKDENKEEFGPGMKGVWNGLWWSAVTMTTVGYGDKSPKTTGGRVVALIWMFTAIIIISGFTASIASSLTVSELEASIKGPEDLKKVKVAAVEATTGASYLNKNNINFEAVENIEKALQILAEGNVGAVVYDEPIMKYTIKEASLDKKIMILPFNFSTQYYSFSLPKNKARLDAINPILLKRISGVEWKATLQEYNLQD